MRHVLRLLVVALVVCVSVCAVSGGPAPYSSFMDDEALPGLGRLAVTVWLPTDLEEAELGLKSELQTQLELRLRMVGLKIKNTEEPDELEEGTIGRACVFLQLNTTRLRELDKVYCVAGFSLAEPVWLDRDKSRTVLATTWYCQRAALAPTIRQRKSLEELALSCIDNFRNVWLKANPKSVGSQEEREQ